MEMHKREFLSREEIDNNDRQNNLRKVVATHRLSRIPKSYPHPLHLSYRAHVPVPPWSYDVRTLPTSLDRRRRIEGGCRLGLAW